MMNEDLIDSIDEYNAAIHLRNNPPSADARLATAIETVVDSHHVKFVLQLEETGGGHG